MKEHISRNQITTLSEYQLNELFHFMVDNENRSDFYCKNLTIGKLMETIRGYCKLDVESTSNGWKVSLYPIDSVDKTQKAIFTNKEKELVDVLFQSLLWIIQNKEALDDYLLDVLLGVEHKKIS